MKNKLMPKKKKLTKDVEFEKKDILAIPIAILSVILPPLLMIVFGMVIIIALFS